MFIVRSHNQVRRVILGGVLARFRWVTRKSNDTKRSNRRSQSTVWKLDGSHLAAPPWSSLLCPSLIENMLRSLPASKPCCLLISCESVSTNTCCLFPTLFCLKHPPPPYFKLSIFNRCGTAEALLSHLIVEKMWQNSRNQDEGNNFTL